MVILILKVIKPDKIIEVKTFPVAVMLTIITINLIFIP